MKEGCISKQAQPQPHIHSVPRTLSPQLKMACERLQANLNHALMSGGARPSDKGGGGSGHPDPEIRRGLQKNFFGVVYK